MGKEVKRRWIKDLVVDKKVGFLCLQETKTTISQEWQITSVWGNMSCNFVSLDSVGHSGGILTVWDNNLFSQSHSIKQDGFVAVLGTWLGSNSKLGILNVYAPQSTRLKKLLWEEILKVLEKESDFDWIVCGDFNEVRSAAERKGSSFDPLGARNFNDFIFSAGLSDLRLGGRSFTWMSPDCSKLSKLDRFLISDGFVTRWPLSNSIALPRLFSDHCPLLLTTGSPNFGPSPFKFYNSWLADPELESLVRDKWAESRPEFEVFSKIERLSRKLRYLKYAIKSWSFSKFKEKEVVMVSLKQRIAAIDMLADVGNVNEDVIKERAELMVALGDLIADKVKDIKQKAKINWLSEGDENSRFFHGVVNNRLKKSRLLGLNINGRWVNDPEVIKSAVFDFYKDKFAEKHRIRPSFVSPLFKKISDVQRVDLERPFSEEEVKEAVWSCGNDKTPGPDGFTFEFIRKYWSIVAKDFFEAVKFFESSHLINPGSNSSFITLVPKIKDPITLADYRPINLVGCVSKVISKVLAERVKFVLDSVVSKNQTGFIKGRNILDGPFLVNEIIQWAKSLKQKLLIFKADFAKAFDTLNWSFLDNILAQMGFGEKWRSWVKGCVGTAKVSVLVNGSPTSEFRMEKGVRQGDPLAPFLFILAAEGLNVAIQEAIRKNLFRGVRLGNSVEDVSILQFADDTIFVGEWDDENAVSLIRILKCFELSSGLKINLNKCRVLGVSTSREEIARMARKLRCKEDSFPFHYLGIPVGGNMNLIKNWQPLIDKFKKRLSIWKAKSLSIGGRLCLCKSVLGSLGTYFFSLYKAPKKVLNILEGLRSRFFWGGTTDLKKINWVAWENVVRDKRCGGLGIGSLRAANLALLAKWWWRERRESDSMWKKVVFIQEENLNQEARPRNKRGTWSSIRGIEKDLGLMGINIHSLLYKKEDGSGWEWLLENNKTFSVSSLRRLIDGINLPIAENEVDWCRWIPNKVNIHMWRFLMNRLATKDNLAKRGVSCSSDDCPLCLSTVEDLDHVFVNCSTTKVISAHLENWLDWWPKSIRDINEIQALKSSITRENLRLRVYKVIIAAFCWSIWLQRNSKLFKGSCKKEIEIFRDIQFLAFDWIRCRTKFGRALCWDRWSCNPVDAVISCITLAPR
ncbi:hypothetical protein OSB04_000621 [Centaurea solstitialis]|uniref:Reverse transcriptase domain-containing protein n=1 Tax=Centaurea solstitialis TaxID=347529 RepID=A0AA38U166_9ASTR|nr:hypothetical protein OSB04_000621 [Centaurea solstitialis]